MSKDELLQISDKHAKKVINIGRFAFNTRMAWLIGSSLFLGSEAFICSAAQPRATTNNHPQSTNNNPVYTVNNSPPTALGEKLSAVDKAKAQVIVEQSRKAIQSNFNDVIAWTNLGEALRRTGDLPGAQQAQEKALQINPKLTEAKLGLALIKKEQGKIAEVIPELRTIEEEGKSAIAHYNLGVELYYQGKLDGAIASYKTAIRINPNLALAHYNLGLALQAQGKLDGAIASYKTAIRINPNLALAHYNLGLALQAQGKLDGAIASYKTAIRINPNLALAHNNLGLALDDQGKLEDAIASYKTAIRINPNLALAHFNLGLAFKKQGKKSDAIAQFQQARPLYQQKGDTKTVADIDRLIQELS